MLSVTAIKPLSRIERRKIEFREKITHAALKLFEEKGVADTSVASIIKDADIAHKTFFNHFPTKDHLLQHIVTTFSDHAYALFREEFTTTTDPKERIEFCFNNIAEVLESLSPNYKELLNFYLISGAGSGDLRRSQKDKFVEVIDKIMVDANAQEMLRPGFSLETLTDMVVGVCVSTLLNWGVEDDYPLVLKMKKSINFINESVFV
jgi:AcrR family transcriptional regulator